MEYVFHILILSGIYAILALSLNIIVGFTGLPSLGHAAFPCVGGYVSSLLALNFKVTPWATLIVGALASAGLGLIVSYGAIRLKNDYLALATLGFAVIVYATAQNWLTLTNGPMGLPGVPQFSIFHFQVTRRWYAVLVAGFVCLTYLTISRVVNSPFGRTLRGIREDEITIQALGKDVNQHKILVFTLGALFAGIAGSLYAHYLSFIDPSSFTVTESLTILLMVIFGGMGSLTGSLLGAFILVLFPELLRFIGMPASIAGPVRQMLYGLLLTIVMIVRPQGILGKFKF